MKKHLLTCIFAAPLLLFAQQTYVWNVASGSWTNSSNWTPARSAPAVNDILEFSANATVTDMPATESIGKLWLHNNAVVNLSSGVASVITIGHATVTAPHFAVAAGTALNVNGANTIALNIGSGYTGEVSGSIDFFDVAHRLTAASAGALVFKNGSVFTANTSFNGNAFGTTNLNSVIFQNGATYTFKTGGNPFGAAAPNAVTVFSAGSIYKHQGTSADPSFAERTYGNLYIDANVNFTAIGSARSCIIQNDLRIVSGYFTFKPNSGSHTGNLNIYGNIICEGTAYIDIGSNYMPGAVQLLGANQTIGSGGGTGAITIKNLTVNNTATLLNRNITVTGTLNMQQGIIQTSSSALLTLSSTAGIQSCTHDYTHLSSYTNMGCDNSYVEGPVQKQGLSNADFAFPVGAAGKLRPLLVRNATGDFTVEFKSSDPYLDISASLGASVHHISHIEYWNITGTGNAAVELTFFDPNSGGITDMAALRVARFTGVQWVDMNTNGYLGTPGSNGSVTGGTTNQFGSFSLASSTNYPNNPLPILLTEWKALLHKNSIMLQWTATEETHTTGYLVERSADGIQFEPISSLIPAEHIYPFTYQLIDNEPLNGRNYYRLKIINADGSASWSKTIAAISPLSTSFRVYPNPAREKIFIKIPASSSISTLAIVHIDGSVVKWINTRNLTIVSVDILNLSPGLYYIKNIRGQSSLVVPFIKYNQK